MQPVFSAATALHISATAGERRTDEPAGAADRHGRLHGHSGVPAKKGVRRFGKTHGGRHPIAYDRVIPAMPGGAAALAFFFDVTHFAAGRHLAIASDDAAAGERGEA